MDVVILMYSKECCGMYSKAVIQVMEFTIFAPFSFIDCAQYLRRPSSWIMCTASEVRYLSTDLILNSSLQPKDGQ
jgi:hypothetical protein